MHALSACSLRALSRPWNGRLAAYRGHQHDEHREALVAEALRFVGMVLENDLIASAYWSEAPLARRAAVLLFLVDRGAVDRRAAEGRYHYEATAEAESWVAAQPSLAPYLDATLELIAALRSARARRLSARG